MNDRNANTDITKKNFHIALEEKYQNVYKIHKALTDTSALVCKK